jgi:cytochrome P450
MGGMMTQDSQEPEEAARARRAAAAEFDPNGLTPEFYENPYPTYAALREFDPVHRCADGTYFLTRYADLDLIYRDRVHFSSDKKTVFGPKFGVGSALYEHHTTSLVFNDPPYHTRVRRHIVGALTPHVLQVMEPQIVALVDGLLDGLEERGRFDLIEDFAAAIPVEVIGNLLRVPREDRGPLRGWSLAILGALEPTVSEEQRASGDRAVREFTDYLRVLVDDRRRLPLENDLLTRLLQEKDLSLTELLHNCVFLLNAGHETTTNLIGNGLSLLLGHPDSLERLRTAPDLIAGTVEECLRCESPNQLGNRLVSERISLRGVTFEPGTYLTLCIGAANRDGDEFPHPEVFDIGRRPNRHLAFAAGAHACAGMSVARLEAQVAILRLIQRFPGMQLTGGAVRGGRARFRGFRLLPAALI